MYNGCNGTDNRQIDHRGWNLNGRFVLYEYTQVGGMSIAAPPYPLGGLLWRGGGGCSRETADRAPHEVRNTKKKRFCSYRLCEYNLVFRNYYLDFCRFV